MGEARFLGRIVLASVAVWGLAARRRRVGSVAALTTPWLSVVSGGLACLGAVALVALLLPDLARYDAAEMAGLGAEPA